MKKLLSISLCFVLITVAFMACQKELSLENGLEITTMAKGSLQDTNGNCLPDTVYGTWYNGVAPGDTNYVQIQVQVDSVGTYIIQSDTQNGLSFRDSGAFVSTGLQTIQLKPSGVALNPATTFFTISFDTSVCTFAVLIKDSTGTGLGQDAEMTLNSNGDTCMNAVVYGKTVEQTALDSTIAVEIEVNVTKPGKYDVSTSTVNGMTYTGSGTVTSTGVQTIVLFGTGTPESPGDYTFPVTIGSSSCSFQVHVVSSYNADNTAWQFTEGGTTMNGFMYSANVVDTLGLKVLYLYGMTPATFDTAFQAALLLPATGIAPGTFSTSASEAIFSYDNYRTDTNIYLADQGDTTVDMQFVITAYDALNRQVQGTFTGTAHKAGVTAPVNITAGSFKAQLDQ
ncbi:hypothetical protein [Foetidibacter luteolus]|uniref:hypothetical protein n=1 Tax=Foetidibacter luteolus TaxID=2608880 RepID=UPI00129B0B36|nr:hypothetical protein [Foetidibacter luteolus]